MKTAYQIAKANAATFRQDGLVLIDQHDLMKAMQEYASQWLDEAANKANVKPMDVDFMAFEVDKDSILNLKSQLK